MKAQYPEYGTAESPSLVTLRDRGFNPIGITTMMLEETFIFETEEEAITAFTTLENTPTGNSILQGWWYGKELFKTIREEYVNFNHEGKEYEAPIVYWLL